MARRILMGLVVLVAVIASGSATAAVTRVDGNGTILVDGRSVFPIVLAKGPPPNATTPGGADAIGEVAGAGVNFLKVGPATVPWTTADVDEAKLEDRAAAAHGAYTWINLSTVSTATAGSAKDQLLQQVETALLTDASASAIGMWKGSDEPWFSGLAPGALQFAYCRSTGRGQTSWCAGEPPLDQDHLWATIQAPRGTSTDLAPYAAVTDVHGVDVYPVTAANPTPDLHPVGTWTSTIAAITPNHSVWTTLQVCASGSVGPNGTFVLPTRAQERFMIYDAIINGARTLAFYGGNNPDCWSSTDSQYGWNWTFWNSTLKSLIGEISAISPLAPALVDPATTAVLTADDYATEVISRAGNAGDLWVLAAHAGTSTQSVTISGLPSSATSADVYVEGRTVNVTGGALTDTFGPWDVHVYHVLPPVSPPPPAAPTITSVTPTSGPAGSRVTIAGTNLGNATAVSFDGVPAGFTVTSSTELSATVPADAATGPISVTTPGGTATSPFAFTVTAAPPPPPPPPPPSGGGGSGGQATPSDLRLGLNAATPSAALSDTDDVTVTAVDAGGGSTHVVLTVNLPSGLTLVGAAAYERGSGCSGQAVLVCNLDFLQPGSPTHIRFSVRATAPGAQTIAASIGASELDANPADNSAALTIDVTAAATPPPPTAPVAPSRARATNHADRLVGTRGPDTLRGLGGGDTIFGLAGNDVLDGGAGNDTLIGGPGRDLLIGGPGNDVISARDGQRDRVRCGTGRDRVIADRVDVVARDCERVVRR